MSTFHPRINDGQLTADVTLLCRQVVHISNSLSISWRRWQLMCSRRVVPHSKIFCIVIAMQQWCGSDGLIIATVVQTNNTWKKVVCFDTNCLLLLLVVVCAVDGHHRITLSCSHSDHAVGQSCKPVMQSDMPSPINQRRRNIPLNYDVFCTRPSRADDSRTLGRATWPASTNSGSNWRRAALWLVDESGVNNDRRRPSFYARHGSPISCHLSIGQSSSRMIRRGPSINVALRPQLIPLRPHINCI